jgi:peptide deformylase
MVYEANGIRANFYEESVKAMSEAEFIAHEKHHGFSEKQLREAYALINPKKTSKAQKAKEDHDSSLSVEKD